MSERLPYEEMDKQFNDLPLPGQEASWQKMKELLDDDDDDIVPPPVFLRSCMGWGILLLVGLIAAWLVIRPEKRWKESAQTKKSSSTKFTERHSDKTSTVQKRRTILIPAGRTKEKELISLPKQEEARPLIKPSTAQPERKKTSPDLIPETNRKYKNRNQQEVLAEKKRVKEPVNIVSGDNTIGKTTADKPDTSSSITNHPQVSEPADTIKALNIPQPNDTAIQKKKANPQKKLFLTAGIGEQQQIPIAGQTAVPYSHYGRKGSLSDYLPSVFVQLQKEKKWFVQAEFRYGAPQSVKEFSFNRKTKLDTFTNNITITTQRLKKTYYHQLPFSFNYYVLPNLSVGIGGVYSRFFGAVTEREITTYNTPTQTVSTVKQIVPIRHFTDSFLYKTQVHALLQADYQWRKFSVELRYMKDIQPYIKYTKPDGTVDEEKNQSLQFIVRYRLWQSKKF
jgi:hypothetical protein